MVNGTAIYADGAELATMATISSKVHGFTTNPSLMRKAGVADYQTFARAVLAIAAGRPVSFEVLADDFAGMERQATKIAGWGSNVYVKIPIVNKYGESSAQLIGRLAAAGVKVNVTAVLSKGQVRDAVEALHGTGIVSIFAGRIADAGRDPMRAMNSARARIGRGGGSLLLWASARQVYDYLLAKRAGCDVITLSPELIQKLPMLGRDLEQYSLETVRQFSKDAEGVTL